MTVGEIISVIAVCLSFIGVVISFLFSSKKESREKANERESNIRNIVEIKNNISGITTSVSEIKDKVGKIDDKIQNDHERIIEHETKIKNLEKEVFK